MFLYGNLQCAILFNFKEELVLPNSSYFFQWRFIMDRLNQISNELIALYRQQLNWWVLGRIDRMDELDILQYDRTRERINYLRRQLEAMLAQ